ncbi:MAG TPA: Rne/Rng family ribonuclease [Thermodesulfovibrionales bacterium]|nr:Rne/Rng family ribonuclease [Thermodesulfovibrionales bacterium]
MKRRILINGLYREEKRVAIVEGDTLVDFYVEVSTKEYLKGNIYKGVVSRIEPGIQAAFVNFGPKKDGFLPLRDINPEYLKGKKEGRRTRIQDSLSKGQELIVQVEKDERDTKGASLTTYLSIPGRYVVMMPGREKVGISRKIEAREDRERLKELFESLKVPEQMGFIVRTAGIDRTADELSNDLKYLTKLWNKIQAESKKAHAPSLIYREQDIAVRTVRDYLTSDVAEVLVDDDEDLKNIKDFLRKTLPWRKINIKFYKDKKPIFARHNIEEQVAKVYERYVYLPSRGYIVIDTTEALTAVDVNSGRSRKEGDVEGTALRTNLEAADEIARQLRLRDLGGLIAIDFIDMESHKNRREVEERLEKALSSDKAHTDIGVISKFGILEMTRERMRPPYFESINRKCEACAGAGVIRTDEMVAISALREIHMKATAGGLKGLQCSLPVGSMNYLVNTRRNDISLIEKECKVAIRFLADTHLPPGQYSISVEKLAEEKAEEEPKKAEHKAERVEHKTEKAERQAHSESAQPTEEVAEQGAEQKTEPRKHPKRRPRSRGRRRPRRAGGAVTEGEGATEASETREESLVEPQPEDAGGE